MNLFSACPAKRGQGSRLRGANGPPARPGFAGPPYFGALRRYTSAISAGSYIPLRRSAAIRTDPDTSIAAEAARRGVTSADLAYDLMLEGRANDPVSADQITRTAISRSCTRCLTHPNTLIGLGDGGAHVGVMCDAVPTWHIRSAIGRGTAHVAPNTDWKIWSVACPGTMPPQSASPISRIEPGLRADINIVDYEALTLQSPENTL